MEWTEIKKSGDQSRQLLGWIRGTEVHIAARTGGARIAERGKTVCCVDWGKPETLANAAQTSLSIAMPAKTNANPAGCSEASPKFNINPFP